MSLGAEGDLRAEGAEGALADGGDEGGDAVAEVGLAPGPAAAEGVVVSEPGDWADGAVCGCRGVDVKDGALVEVDVGGGAHAPGGLAGRVEGDAEYAAGDIEFFIRQAAFFAVCEFGEGVMDGQAQW